MKKYLEILFIIIFCLSIGSCKKFTTVDDPINQVGSESVFETDATASSAIAGIYAEIMSVPNQPTNSTLTFYAGLSADELRFYQPDVKEQFTSNELKMESHAFIDAQLWGPLYKIIYVTNVSLEKLAASTSLTPSLKDRLTGECLYVRAWQYFILVNLFGDVPLCLSSDYRANAVMPRTAATTVWEQIITDLNTASELLPETYALNERTVPNKWAARALLAKSYLYQQDWDSVIATTNEVVQSGVYQLLPNLNNVFLRGSAETLWQVASISSNRNSWEGFNFIPSSNNAAPGYVARPELLNSFEANDQRFVSWLKQRTYAGNILYYPFKYKVRTSTPPTEFQVVMRYAELLLMRAEANLQKNGVAAALPDINKVRNRAGLASVTPTISTDSCMRLLVKERRSELFAEWGNRWFDLKRWNKATEVLGVLKPATWQPTDVLYPIPQTQIDLNRNLVQNAGY